MDLDPPLRVGRLRASVPRPDRTGLKEQLLRGLWLTQAGGGSGTDGERTCGGRGVVTLQQREARRAFSPGTLSLAHGTLAVPGCTGSREGRCGE